MYSIGLDVDKLVFTYVNFIFVKILLYAGNSCINSPLVFIFIAIGIIYLFYFFTKGVLFCKKIKRQSAGNFSTKATPVFWRVGSTRNTYTSYKNLLPISEHVPIKKELSNEEFAYFLAGLIEGCAIFDYKQLQIFFSFAQQDISLAYYIKKRVGYGKVNKDKKAGVRYICENISGLSIIFSLINGKLVSNFWYDHLIKHSYSEQLNLFILPPSNKLSFTNHWLAGFSQAQACFYINVPSFEYKTHIVGYNVTLEYCLRQNDKLPLQLLYKELSSKDSNKDFFMDWEEMGNISIDQTGIWSYKSSGYKTVFTLIKYFDNFNLFAGKYTSYLKFRKVYVMITEGKHLEEKGIKKIIKKSKNIN